MSREKQIDSKKALRLLKELAELNGKRTLIYEKLNKIDPFCDCDWDATDVYAGCTVKDGCLYDSDGELLSNNGSCMDDKIPYFVNQYTGYCEDDYHGTMFVKVDDDNTFVAVQYEC